LDAFEMPSNTTEGAPPSSRNRTIRLSELLVKYAYTYRSVA
jgi:hypothetical protein